MGGGSNPYYHTDSDLPGYLDFDFALDVTRAGAATLAELAMLEGLPAYDEGDIDHNRVIDLRDAILALRVLGGQNPGGIDTDIDVNNDGRIGIEEAIYVLQIVSGIRPE